MNSGSSFTETSSSPSFIEHLCQYPNWVCHGPDKVPLRIQDGLAASPTNPVDWVDFATAVAFAQAHPGYGLGFVLTAECQLTCIDLDTYKVDKAELSDEQKGTSAQVCRLRHS